jgi:hypothetical protein
LRGCEADHSILERNRKGPGGEENDLLRAFSDSNFAEDGDDRRSTTGNIFIFNAVPLPWSSEKKCVALSIAKSDYILANLAAKKIVWQRLFYLKSEVNRKVQPFSSVITSQHFDWSTISPIIEPSTFKSNFITYEKCRHIRKSTFSCTKLKSAGGCSNQKPGRNYQHKKKHWNVLFSCPLFE